MCHHVMPISEERDRSHCGCPCSCPAMTSVEDEIQLLEKHRKFMQEQAEVIEKKLTALKSAKGS